MPVVIARAERPGCAERKADCTAEAAVEAYDLTASGAGCYSGCFFAFAAATRHYAPNGVPIGVHQPRIDPQELADIVRSLRIVADEERFAKLIETDAYKAIRQASSGFLREMGADDGVLGLIDATPAESMHILTKDELVGFRLVPAGDDEPPFPVR